ncbi:hypothetical protein ACFFX0_27555 [Citricoccus parietis]|uniref:Uncharacterized protein n=1 Tax=Citricoccus parietis TaxID=592307 RepID=A0ABV5G716_9MICC
MLVHPGDRQGPHLGGGDEAQGEEQQDGRGHVVQRASADQPPVGEEQPEGEHDGGH